MEEKESCFTAGKAVKITLCYVLILFIFLSSPLCAFALNTNLVESEQNGWYEVDDITLYEEADFSGVLKKIVDEEDGCVYIFFQFDDSRVKRTELDNIIISFTVKNSLSEYRFSVNRNGFVNTGDYEKDNIKICWNFDHLSHRGSFNYLFVGFELCNKADRVQNNEITCLYGCGNEKVYTLFRNESLNMYKPEVSTSKADKSSKASTKSTKAVKSSTTSKSNKTAKQTTTKYTPTGLIGAESKGEQTTDNGVDLSDEYKSTSLDEANNAGGVKTEYSTSTKVLCTVAVACAVTGIILITYGTAKKTGNRPEEDKTE